MLVKQFLEDLSTRTSEVVLYVPLQLWSVVFGCIPGGEQVRVNVSFFFYTCISGGICGQCGSIKTDFIIKYCTTCGEWEII